MVRGAQGDIVNQTAALEEGALAVNATAIVFAALAHVDDTTFCCASKSWFDLSELPFEVFYCHHPGGMFYGVSVSWWPPHGPKPSPLEVD
jgi:hypothetical protein